MGNKHVVKTKKNDLYYPFWNIFNIYFDAPRIRGIRNNAI